ncbi:hypothetical protein BBH99_07010 [Chryseobacterium contaminans]|uniref:DUF4421 domain-containing protein n=1 Tax=Chryseobacterium contaminans TaxID=1423959 RepID=A0A1M6V832_9FLAO|nr:DUF4421 family protein [Chryseobacterium contaminans]OCA78969.1 hypothetical protein BBH99_07010 [Chryseobacterium contaminans]SHK77525.1 protein of unknown function [Chryseobacterium contaminans]
MSLIRVGIVVLFALLAIKVNAQQDTANIKSYENQVMIRANLDTNIESYIVKEGEGENEKQQIFSINNKTKVSLSIDYRIISATLSFAPKFFQENEDNDLKGNSSYTDFSVRFFPRRLIQTLYYKNVKGFYIENMKENFPDWKEGAPYLQFPNLRVQSFGGSTAYILNENFSARSIYTQGEWQKKSSGSWVPFLDYDLTIFRDKVAEQNLKETQYKIGANMGYFYNWVLGKNVNISPYLALGLGGKFSTYRDVRGDGTIKNAQYITLRMEGGLNIGYNTDRFLFGGRMNFSAYTYNQNRDRAVQNNSLYGLLYIGYRFAPPRVVENTYDKIQKKIPVL